MFLVNVHIKGRNNDLTLFFDSAADADIVTETLKAAKKEHDLVSLNDGYGHKLCVHGDDIGSIVYTDCTMESRVNIEMTLLGEYNKIDVEKAIQSDSKLRFKQNMRHN